MYPQKNSKNIDGHVRISDAEKAMMENMGIGFSRVFRIGLDTLKMWIQEDTLHSCSYLYNTGKTRSAPSGTSSPPPAPLAHACPCPACPIRHAFPDRAASCRSKEIPVSVAAGTLAYASDTAGPGGARTLHYLDRIE